jgi:hypothetical protein
MGQAMIRESTQPTNICLVKIDHFRKMACRSAGSKSTTRWRCCKRANLPALEQFQCLQTILPWAESSIELRLASDLSLPPGPPGEWPYYEQFRRLL